MGNREYLAFSGTLFSLVALAHLARVINGWPIQVADWSVPMVFSYVGFVVPMLLAVWAFRLVRAGK
jgi:hypothetical protein